MELQNWNNYSAELHHNNLLFPPKLVFVPPQSSEKAQCLPQKHREPIFVVMNMVWFGLNVFFPWFVEFGG